MPSPAAEMIDRPWTDLSKVLGEVVDRNLLATLSVEDEQAWQMIADEFGDTIADGSVTLRERDSMEQRRVAADELVGVLHEAIAAWRRPEPAAVGADG